MNHNNPYQPIPCQVEEIIEESPNIKTLVLLPSEDFSFNAGQFVSLTVPGVGEAPFTPSSSPFALDTIEITIMKAGKVTSAIHSLKKGSMLGMRGPYGNGYSLELFKKKEILLVGGGVGLAPLRSLFLALLHQISEYKQILFCCGAKTPQDYIYKDQVFNEWLSLCENLPLRMRLAVDKEDDAWDYMKGVVTCTLDNPDMDVHKGIAVVCGPPVMMKFSTLKLLDLGFPEENIFLSMERKMYCGIGHCRHCMVGPYFVCKEGPVFSYRMVKEEASLWA
ncbi:MAG: FAD/NAD(P)-binding protein [Candidatus Ratteibacteria bacterium]